MSSGELDNGHDENDLNLQHCQWLHYSVKTTHPKREFSLNLYKSFETGNESY